jgi:hypothetical protein
MNTTKNPLAKLNALTRRYTAHSCFLDLAQAGNVPTLYRHAKKSRDGKAVKILADEYDKFHAAAQTGKKAFRGNN